MLIKDFIEISALGEHTQKVISALDDSLKKADYQVASVDLIPLPNTDDVALNIGLISQTQPSPYYAFLNESRMNISFGRTKNCFCEAMHYEDISPSVFAKAAVLTLNEFVKTDVSNKDYDNSLYQTVHFRKEKSYEEMNHNTLHSALSEFASQVTKAQKIQLPTRLHSRNIDNSKLLIEYHPATDSIIIKDANGWGVKELIRTLLCNLKTQNLQFLN